MRKKTLSIFLVLICIWNIGIGQDIATKKQEEFEKYTNKEKNYEINYPKSWTKRTAPNFDLILVLQGEDGQITATMNVISEFIGKGITLDTFYNENLPTIEKELKNAKIEEKGEENINGIDSKWVLYTHEMNEMKFRVLQYFIAHNGFAYLITFTAITDEFPKYEKEFKEILKTFRILAAELETPATTKPTESTTPSSPATTKPLI